MEEKVKQTSSTSKENKKEEFAERKKLGLDLTELKELFQLLKECNIDEFELKKPGLKIRVKQETIIRESNILRSSNLIQDKPIVVAHHESPVIGSTTPAVPVTKEEIAEDLQFITSPIVGTFYRAPNPNAEPYVDVNQVVKKGQVVCIIEAMKIMNEIESDVEGEIVAIYVGNGEPVEFGQKLMAVRLKK